MSSLESSNGQQKIEVKLREKKRSSLDPTSERPIGIIEIVKVEGQKFEELVNNDSESASSKDSTTRPLKLSSRPNSEDFSQEQKEYIEEDTFYSSNLNPVLDSVKQQKKSDSLDSTQAQACCTKLAFNIYNKALDSAKKRLPKNKQKNRHSGGFPRSFGEDFHSLGPEGFYYLDDSQTECSIDYRDIEFNRDSFLFTGSEVISELSKKEFFQNQSKEQTQPQLIKLYQMDSMKQFNSANLLRSHSPPRIPENTPLSSVENLPTDLKQISDLKPELKRKAPSLFERLFKKDKIKHNVESMKARSEPREVEREKNFRAQSLPPAAFSKHPQPPTVKIGEDGKLWFEHKTIPSPMNPDEVYLTNVTRQSPIKLVYGKPPEIIVQEVTNLSQMVDPLERTTTLTTVDDVAEKTMTDILDDAIKQLQEENNIPIYANQDLSDDLKIKKNRKKRKPVAIQFSKPNFLKKFKKKSTTIDNRHSTKNDSEFNLKPQESVATKIIEVKDSLEMPLAKIDKETSEKDSFKEKKEDKYIINKRKIFTKTFIKPQTNSSVKIKVKGRQKTGINRKIPSLKESSRKLFLSKRRPFRKKFPTENEPEKRKFRLPKIPESRSSTLGSHLYEGIGDIKNQQLSKLKSNDNSDPMAIEIEIGIPLDAPYEELEESSTFHVSPFHRYPDDMEIKAPEFTKNNMQQKSDPAKPQLKIETESPEFNMKIPENEFGYYKPPEIIIKIPENAKPEFSLQTPDNNVLDSSNLVFSPSDVTNAKPLFISQSSKEVNELPASINMQECKINASKFELQAEQINNLKGMDVPNNSSDLYEEPESKTKPMKEKVDKLRDMAGSLGQSFKTKMKDLIQKKSQITSTTDPKVIDVTMKMNSDLKETNLDEQIPNEMKTNFQLNSQSETSQIQPLNTTTKVLNVINDYRVDTTVDDEEIIDTKNKQIKKLNRKFKFKMSSSDEPKDSDKLIFNQKNRERLEQIRSRTQKSFIQLADKLKQQKQAIQERTRSMKTKSPSPTAPYSQSSYDPYQYDLHFASDSELSPGTGIDSLRRSKVFQEIAEAQERLEMYLTPVDRHEPRRPPRRKNSGQIHEDTIFNNSLPSLTINHNRLAKPPRPPPPHFNSCQSVPFSISVTPCEEEISLGTSTSSLRITNPDSIKRQRFPRRQRVPPEIFYKNVRLGYRPKKSYVELLQKSQPFYSMVNQQTIERSQSTGQLYGRHIISNKREIGIPVPPLRKSRTLYVKTKSDISKEKNPILKSKPPISAHQIGSTCASNCHNTDYNVYTDDEYRSPINVNSILPEGKNYHQMNSDETLKPFIHLNWEPYTWKMKRCRSFTELEVRERLQKKQYSMLDEKKRDSIDRNILARDETLRLQRAHSIHSENRIRQNSESIRRRFFRWLNSTTSLDSWKQRTNPNKAIGIGQKTPSPHGRLRIQNTIPTNNTMFYVSNNSSISFLNNDPIYYYHNNNIYNYNDFVADDLRDNGTESITPKSCQRPLPPPPVPPRPRLIPAHYVKQRPKTRDVACDTSENGFHTFCEEQNKSLLINDKINRLVINNSDRNRKSLSIDSNENDEDLTLVEDHQQVLNGSIYSDKNNNTLGSVYVDAATHQTNTNANMNNEKTSIPRQWSSDDDTINDDLSSLSSSHYHSVVETLTDSTNNYLQQIKNESFLHRNSKHNPMSTSLATDEYHSTDEISLPQQSPDGKTLPHCSSIMSEHLDYGNYEDNEVSDYNQFEKRFVVNSNKSDPETDVDNIEDDPIEKPSTNNNNVSLAMSKENKNRQSCISTESVESSASTSSTTSNAYSYSSESNKSLPTHVSNNKLEVDDKGMSISISCTTGTSIDATEAFDANLNIEKNKNKKKNDSNKKFSSTVSHSEISGPFTINNSFICPTNPTLRENLNSLPEFTPKGLKPDKRYYCVHEFYTTERDYVDVLILLTKEFRDFIRPYVSSKWLDIFFRPLDLVTPLNSKLLEELRKRILEEWDDNPKISDILIQICPYFKEYSIYIREFDQINAMLDDAITRFDNFEMHLKSFENTDRCRKLTIKSHLLKPIQRLPQYRLMLMAYLKLLNVNSLAFQEEYEDTRKALMVVSDVIEHIERESLMAERSLTLNELRNRIILTKPTKIVIPGRILIRRGQLDKVSRKEVHVRYFILFNDVLFYLTPVMNGMYKLKEELPLLGMQVEISPNFPTEFIVRSVKRSFALLTRDEQEREQWVKDLRATIADHTEKQQSFKNRHLMDSFHPTDLDLPSFPPVDHQRASIMSTESGITELNLEPSLLNPLQAKLGDLAPVWLHDNRVTMCRSCTAQFTFLNRRHHCRACGHIFCAECSSHQFPLKYLNNKADRVCDGCYEVLSGENFPSNSNSPTLQRNSLDDSKGNKDQDDETIDDAGNGSNVEDQTPVIAISMSPSLKNSTSTSSSSSLHFLLRKNRSNSCHELRNNQVKMVSDANQLGLLRNNNIRLSSRLKQKNVSAILFEVSANDPTALISGWLHRYVQKKSWKRYWFVIKNMVLYWFKASEDVRALDTLPLPGYEVSISDESIKGFPAELIIKLSHPGQSTIYFFTETEDNLKR